jgi:hypothetical protein
MRLTPRGWTVLAVLLVLAAAVIGANIAPANWFAPQLVRTATR